MTLESVLLTVVRGAAFLVPPIALVCGNELFFKDALFPNIVWKNFIFRILVEVMVGLWAVVAWSNPRYRPRFTWILGCYAAFIAALAIADFAGVRPAYSFWGNYERMEGLIGHLHLFAFTVVLTCVFDTEKLWRTFLLVSLSVCMVVWGFGLHQYMRAFGLYDGNPQIFHQPVPVDSQGRTYHRVDARLASPVFLGVYMVTHTFIAALLALRAKGELRWAIWVAAGLAAVMVFMTETRVAQVGLVGGSLLALGLMAARSTDPGLRKIARWGALVIAALVVVVIVLAWIKPPALSEVPVLRRIVNLAIDRALLNRFLLWGMLWEGFLQHPLFGWGQENFAYVFNEHYHPGLFGREQPNWWDHPHNVYLYWLNAGGLCAFVPYLGLYVTAFWYLWRRARIALAERCLWTGMIVGYAVYNTLQLDNLLSYVYFFVALAYIHVRSATPRPPGDAPARPVGLRLGVTAVAIAAIAGAIYRVNVWNMDAGLAVANAAHAVHDPDPRNPRQRRHDAPEALRQFDIALATAGPMALSQTRDQISKLSGTLIQSPQVDQAHKNQLAQLSVDEMRKEVEENPGNVNDRYFLGLFLNLIRRPTEALQYLEPALAINPRRQLMCYQVAESYLQLGRKAEASELFRQAWQARPTSKEARVQSCMGAILADDRALYGELLTVMRTGLRTKVFRVDQRIIRVAATVRWWQDVVDLLEPIVDEWKDRLEGGTPMPKDARERFEYLIEGYWALGRVDDACALVRFLIDYDIEQVERWRMLFKKNGCK